MLERGDYVPREKDNWSTAGVNVEGKYQTKEDLARPRRQGAASAHQLLRGRQHEVLRRGAVPFARAKTSASSGITAESRRPGRSPMTNWSRTTRRPSSIIMCTASAAKIPPIRRQRALSVSGGEPRAAHAAVERRFARRGSEAVSHAARHACSTRRIRTRAIASAVTPATDSPAWCTPSPTRRCSAWTRRWSIPMCR